jgi:hypothetical protein
MIIMVVRVESFTDGAEQCDVGFDGMLTHRKKKKRLEAGK